MQTDHNRIPIIRLWKILLVPLQGEITDELAQHLSQDVLSRIHNDGASGLVIDVTGLWVLDSHLCSVLAELASAASLMGARTLISGINPDIAITLETMGVRLGDVVTTLDLESALYVLGVSVVADEEGTGGNNDLEADLLADFGGRGAHREKLAPLEVGGGGTSKRGVA